VTARTTASAVDVVVDALDGGISSGASAVGVPGRVAEAVEILVGE